MTQTAYIDICEINKFQTSIMQFVSDWVHQQRTPVPQKEVIIAMEKLTGRKYYTTVNALNSLLKKGYIRKTFTISNTVHYVQLRTI